MSFAGKHRDRDGTDVVAGTSLPQGHVPPHDLEAERAVLGGILLDNTVLATVEAILTPADFYHPAHALIFEAIQSLSQRGEPVDVVTLTAEMRSRERLNTVGGVQYLGELTDTIPTIAHIEQHARIVADLAQLRRMINVAHEIAARGLGEHGPVDQFLDYAAARVFEVAQKRSKSSLIPLERAIHEAFERIEKTLERGARITGIETGFRDLDVLTAGMHPGQLIIVAARPAMGKTSLVLNITTHAAITTGKPVLFFSLEMPRIELANRLMCAEAGVDQARLRANMLTQDDMTALTHAANRLYTLPIYIDDSGDLTLLELRAKARRMKSERDLALVVIDYLQLMKASREGMESREREISEISRGLKSLAKELDVPIVALSQLNRAPETRPGKDRRPQLSDLRECVTGDTLVVLADGQRVPIRELVGTTPTVLAMSPEGTIVQAVSDKVWSVGPRPVFRLTLACGRTLRATATHRLYGPDGWIQVQQLRPGDRLAIVPHPSPHTRREASPSLRDQVSVHATDACCWDRVVEIVPAGEEEVFDLTVPGPASWLADGIVSHNSGAIEQDADVVIFIYRDEVYNRDTEDKGIAELIVAKQRNGPTDTVRLRFIRELTKFENLAEDERDYIDASVRGLEDEDFNE